MAGRGTTWAAVWPDPVRQRGQGEAARGLRSGLLACTFKRTVCTYAKDKKYLVARSELSAKGKKSRSKFSSGWRNRTLGLSPPLSACSPSPTICISCVRFWWAPRSRLATWPASTSCWVPFRCFYRVDFLMLFAGELKRSSCPPAPKPPNPSNT